VRTDVEGQITGLEELSVEALHPTTPPDRAVVGDERPGDASNPAERGEHSIIILEGSRPSEPHGQTHIASEAGPVIEAEPGQP
jgi:hypothetical protein